jgi:hypothetical protein
LKLEIGTREMKKPWKKEETLRENQSNDKKKTKKKKRRGYCEEGDQKVLGRGY